MLYMLDTNICAYILRERPRTVKDRLKQVTRKGRVIGPYDLQIAAHTLSLGAVIATNNEREFVHIPCLKLENWTTF